MAFKKNGPGCCCGGGGDCDCTGGLYLNWGVRVTLSGDADPQQLDCDNLALTPTIPTPLGIDTGPFDIPCDGTYDDFIGDDLDFNVNCVPNGVELPTQAIEGHVQLRIGIYTDTYFGGFFDGVRIEVSGIYFNTTLNGNVFCDGCLFPASIRNWSAPFTYDSGESYANGNCPSGLGTLTLNTDTQPADNTINVDGITATVALYDQDNP